MSIPNHYRRETQRDRENCTRCGIVLPPRAHRGSHPVRLLRMATESVGADETE
ncbi:MAG: hypothetical protein PVF59_10210 [Desulfobacterales bacterium]